ncbi:glutathione S-transferase [Dissoconium aciculare CBS 342.82]|uniref:Glutathione S-transferase n=1 Tax=Dissoconium aciculare CBS 342.82 TaxID=1314786 RepID=A0A6J3MA19_9PEZI|nr:glutathione S-transferase [Dissoconium aciculare CBS 342.82]KAF1823657.1 glutathione S-transferase [Dissoconium aciculare CBS 342.82]
MDKIKNVLSSSTAVKAEKPIKLYSHAGGPNPWKVAIILEELNVPYHNELLDFSVVKQEPFISVNPNGRVPAIEDPNTGLTVWESGAIIEYLLDTYDPTHKLSYASGKEKYDGKCWLHFQTSGQGPYFGQRVWFSLYHSEKNLTSVLDRYGNEISRVIGVIDSHLKKTGKEYLVGDRVTYADLAFVPWFWLILYQPHVMGEGFPAEWQAKFPHAWAWNQRLEARPSVIAARDARAKAMGK